MPYLGTPPASELANLDINGQKLIIDADADTSITADTDDQIDIEIAGADDFQFTANTFTAAASSVIALDDGAVATPSLTTTGDLNTGVYFPAADNVGVVAGGTEKWRFGGNLTTSRNLLLNGGFQVWQRGTSFTGVGASATTYVADGWSLATAGSTPQARLTVTRDTTVPKVGGYSIKMDVTTAEAAVAVGENLKLITRIEGQDLQHLGWGSGGALRDISVSFWFRSPKTGIHNVYIYQSSAGAGGAGRSMVKEFTIAVADTFEFFSLTFAADSGGGFSNVTTQGLELGFPVLCGSSQQASADTWTTANKYCTSNVQNLADSTSNDIYVADVQLEVGPSTDFDYLPYATILAKCQRYFWKIVNSPEADNIIAQGRANTTSAAVFTLSFPQTMRASPTMADSNDADFQVNYPGASSAVLSGLAAIHIQDSFTSLQCTTATELTAGHAVELRFDGGSTRFMSFSAEL